MSLTTGRSEKRTPVDLALVLSSLSERPFKERAFTENVSSHGLRTISKRMWTPGARLLVSFEGGPSRERPALFIVNAWQTRSSLWARAIGQGAAIGRLILPRPSAPLFTSCSEEDCLEVLGRNSPQQRRSRHNYENCCPYPIFPAGNRGGT